MPSFRSIRRLAVVAPLLLLAPAVAAAQDSAAAPGAPAAPTASPLVVDSLAGRRLAAGTWTYLATVSRGGDTVELGKRTLTVSAAADGGRDAWLLLDRTESQGQTLHDSLFVARDDLRPLRRHVRIGPMEVRLAVRGDSIVGAVAVPDAPESPIALVGKPGLVLNSGALESALSLAALGPSWSATVHQLAVSPVGTSLVPLTVAVVGEDSVTVPAGTFRTWVVEMTAAEVAQRLWVDQATGRVVRTVSPAPQLPDVVYETVLVAVAVAGAGAG